MPGAGAARLELAFNNCIDMLLRFFTKRWELVRMMFGEEVCSHLTYDWEQERAPSSLRGYGHHRAAGLAVDSSISPSMSLRTRPP